MNAGYAFSFLPIIFYVIGLLILYWVIRLAVRHAIQDADNRRRQQP
ncbi:MAG: hypothetical protein IRY85_19585 [Micromonosporaceae bacterium]|nr:hypothetical protein [Micromonosporaceae bacterium]